VISDLDKANEYLQDSRAELKDANAEARALAEQIAVLEANQQ
jgi:hypothetical protein